MTGLALVLAEADGPRVEAALELAAAAAALGDPVGLFLSRDALRLLGGGAAPLTILLELGADVGVCQTSMAARGIDAAGLPPGIEPLGLVGFLSERRGWRILMC
ncbi:MAG: DsrE family protein [Thermaurantiacus sp.]